MSPQPSVLLITIDDLRFDGVFPNLQTDIPEYPVLDELSSDGAIAYRCHANATGTKRSFPGIFSGQHYYRYGGDTEGFDETRPHLAEVLQDQGYETAGFHSNPFLDEQYGYARGFDYFNSQPDGAITDGLKERTVKRATNVITDNDRLFSAARTTISLVGSHFGVDPRGQPYADAAEMNSRALAILEDLSTPFFLWVHYMDVHSPWYPRQNTRSEGVTEREAMKAFHRYRRDPEGVGEATISLLKRLYYGEVEYLMQHLNELLDGVRERTSDLFSVLVSDHGEAFGEHGYYRHPWGVHNELTHVPFFVGGSGRESTARIRTPTTTLDVAPTILEAAGLPSDDQDGIPIQRQLDRDDRYVVSQSGPPDRGVMMVSNRRWKLIKNYKTGSVELFEYATDYDETTDCSNEHSEIVKELSAVLNDVRADILEDVDAGPEDGDGGADSVSGDVKQRLEHLGYADDL